MEILDIQEEVAMVYILDEVVVVVEVVLGV